VDAGAGVRQRVREAHGKQRVIVDQQELHQRVLGRRTVKRNTRRYSRRAYKGRLTRAVSFAGSTVSIRMRMLRKTLAKVNTDAYGLK